MITYDELASLEEAFEAALFRVETGVATVEDAETVRRYVEVAWQLIEAAEVDRQLREGGKP